MPLVRFNVPQALSADRLAGLRDAVHEALVAFANVPQDDRFHIVHRFDPEALLLDAEFPGHARSPDAVIVEITFRLGRTDDQKKGLFREIARLARARAGMQPDDVMVVLSENTSLDWSFGGGVAHYAQTPLPA